MTNDRPITLQGLLHLIVVYIVWSSTYLAIRVAVRPGAGFPPFALGATRVLIGGGLMLALSRLQQENASLSRTQWRDLALSGLLLWLGGNGMVNWAEQRADSSLAALLIAATPIWVAIVEAVLDRKAPTWRLVAALLVGFSGIVVLSWPVLRRGVRADILALLALLFAGFSWGMGSILQSRRLYDIPPVLSAGAQHTFGGLGFLLVALLRGEPLPTPTPAAWLALAYLIVFGSLLAFTSYVRALQLLPTPVVMTYSYVNPVLAVFLGWLILSEPITSWTFAGAALVLLGVAGVFHERRRKHQV
ncbi:MAG: EamA family transporter [Anaerolineae bacterium]|nr:MAG: EamA family transporter [Anaerolineae bacterium]